MKKAMLVVLCAVFLVGLADMGHAFLWFGGGGGGGRAEVPDRAWIRRCSSSTLILLKTKSWMTETSIITWVTGTMGTGGTKLEAAVG